MGIAETYEVFCLNQVEQGLEAVVVMNFQVLEKVGNLLTMSNCQFLKKDLSKSFELVMC